MIDDNCHKAKKAATSPNGPRELSPNSQFLSFPFFVMQHVISSCASATLKTPLSAIANGKTTTPNKPALLPGIFLSPSTRGFF